MYTATRQKQNARAKSRNLGSRHITLCSFSQDSVNCVTLYTFKHIIWEVERLVVFKSHCIENFIVLQIGNYNAPSSNDIFWHSWPFYSTDGLHLRLRVKIQMVAGCVFQHGEGQGHTRITRICWVWDKRTGEWSRLVSTKSQICWFIAISALDTLDFWSLRYDHAVRLQLTSLQLWGDIVQPLLEASGDLVICRRLRTITRSQNLILYM